MRILALVSNLFKWKSRVNINVYLRKQNLNFKINFYNIEMTYTHVGEIQRKGGRKIKR